MIQPKKLFLYLGFLSLTVLSACEEGEVIPLIPPQTNCERPLDFNWQTKTNICSRREPIAAVWPEGEMPVVIGEYGFILECDSEKQWTEIDLHLEGDLIAVACNEIGDVVTAGVDGTMAYRKNGIWKTGELPVETTWRDVEAQGESFWLAGADGLLAQGTPGGSWSMIDFPDSTDLYSICAFEDSVFVGGSGGVLKVLVNGQWSDQSLPGEFLGPIQSMVRLDDGRLVVLVANSFIGRLWVREPEGWNRLDYYFDSNTKNLHLNDGYLWLDAYQGFVRFNLSMDPWVETSINSPALDRSVAFGSDGQFFLAAKEGELAWGHFDAEDNLIYRLDPAGYLRTGKLSRLADGTVVFPVEKELFKINSTGVEKVSSLSFETENNLEYSSMIHGESLDDFYFSSDMKLRRVQGGGVVMELDIPADNGSSGDFRVNDAGQICQITQRAILFWTGSQWDTWGEAQYSRVYLTQQQNFVVTYPYDALYFANNELIPIDLMMNARWVWESEPGKLEFLGVDINYTQWCQESGVEIFDYLDPLLGCPFEYMRSITESPAGILVALNSHSMVLKLPADPAREDWELVAGPCMHQISSLEVLNDGSLVALGDNGRYIITYPSTGH